jgi:hypothetical protein
MIPEGFCAAKQLRMAGEFEPGQVAAYEKAQRDSKRITIEMRELTTGTKIFRCHAVVLEVNDEGDTVLGLEVVASLEVPASVLREIPAPRRARGGNGDAMYPAGEPHGSAGRRRRRSRGREMRS